MNWLHYRHTFFETVASLTCLIAENLFTLQTFTIVSYRVSAWRTEAKFPHLF